LAVLRATHAVLESPFLATAVEMHTTMEVGLRQVDPPVTIAVQKLLPTANRSNDPNSQGA